MKAVIMAGGEGTRLRPLTCNRPKPMVPIMNKPVMEHIVKLLKQHNIVDIAATLQYLPQVIQDYFGDGSELGVNMHYFLENTPLGTAGSVKNAQEFLDDTFIVISGDALTDIDLTDAIKFHHEKKSVATLILTKVDVPLEYGVVVTDEEGKITRFLEKPSWSEVFSETVNTGIYILNPSVLDYIKPGEMFDFSKDLFPQLLRDNKPMYGFVASQYWCDIGDLGAYQQCHFDILEGKVNIRLDAVDTGNKVFIEDGVSIEDGAKIEGPVLIGRNTHVKRDAQIMPFSVIGRDNIISGRSSIKRTILWKGCSIGEKVQLRGCTLCNKVNMKESSAVYENSIIGEDTLIKERAVIKPGIKIWPSKVVESDTEVNTNLIWGAKYSRALFGEKGIVGEINVDITPEFASRLGAAYGALFKNGTKIAISCDDTNAAGMLKSSFTAGLMSSGVQVYDFGQQLLPITRSAIRFYGLEGGIHLGTVARDEDARLYIDFLDALGANINRGVERKLESAFIREDFSRCEPGDVKALAGIQDYKSFYLRDIINKAQNKALGYKLYVNTGSVLVESLITSVMNELKCDIDITHIYVRDIQTGRPMQTSSQIGYFCSEVVASKSDIGVVIDESGEKLFLIDEKGRFVSEEMFMVLVSLITLRTMEGSTIVVPISAPSVIEDIAVRYHGNVVRTKTSSLEVMGKIATDAQKNPHMFDQFVLYFDAIGSLVKIMDYMKSNQLKLSELVDRIPAFHMVKKEVECPWDAKGKVIRQIIRENSGERMEQVEGVKVYRDGGWVLVIPDAEKPVCKVIGEGYSAEFAESLTDFYVNRVKEIGSKSKTTNPGF